MAGTIGEDGIIEGELLDMELLDISKPNLTRQTHDVGVAVECEKRLGIIDGQCPQLESIRLRPDAIALHGMRCGNAERSAHPKACELP